MRADRHSGHVIPEGRWHRLFEDLEAEAEAGERAALTAEVADRTRAETARITLLGRLRAARGHLVTCHLVGAGTVAGTVREVGPDWFLVDETVTGEAVVALAALASLTGLGVHSAAPHDGGTVGARLDLRYALRRLARGRVALQVVLVDGSVVAGTLDRVGADFVDVAEHPLGEARRRGAVRQVRTVPLRALAVLRPAL